MSWTEELPEKCPPEQAFTPNSFTVYRLATTEGIDEVDFKSQRFLKPLPHVFKGVDECVARSLSVYNEVQKCVNMVKLPIYKNRWKAILELQLNNTDGLVLKTFADPNHYSWWRSAKYDINKATVVNS